jgi:predicted DNA binding CopG/RHH family protein
MIMIDNTKLPPIITVFLDEEEEELYNIIESDDYDPGPSLLTPELRKEYMKMARAKLDEDHTKISMWLLKADFEILSQKAARENASLETWIGSVLHKAASS